MLTIKKSYGKCEECDLIDAPSCILETNTNGKLEDTEILFVAENPGKDEVEQGVLMVGKSGKIFRTPFELYFKNDFKWTISNCVLCLTLTPEGKTGNPSDKQVENCKQNLFELIKICDPKVIFLMGGITMKLFGIMPTKAGIIKKMGQFYEWNGRKVYLTCHPSYVNNNGGLKSDIGKTFEKHFKEIRKYMGKTIEGEDDEMSFDLPDEPEELLTNDDFSLDILVQEDEPIIEETIEDDSSSVIQKGEISYSYKIPDKYYTDDYRLIDIQYVAKQDRLIFIFRDKDNAKLFYEPPRVTNNYYYYESLAQGKILEEFKNLKVVQCNFKNRLQNQRCYGSDVPIETLNAVDYYLGNKEEAIIVKQNILFFDIEVYSYKDRGFPTAEKSEYPISSVSFCINDEPIQSYLLNIPRKDSNENMIDDSKRFKELQATAIAKKWDLIIFDNEVQMIKQFANKIKSMAPDIITAWNIGFDLGYIYNRMKRLIIEMNLLSPFDNCFVDAKSGYCMITGFVILDLMDLYKDLTEAKEVSYSLENISMKVLDVGKLEHEGSLNELYENDVETYIDYNRVDVERIRDLNNKLRHVEMMNELRLTATTTWKGVSSTIGQADGLFLTNLKKRGMCPRNRIELVAEKEKIPGAYVKKPIGGLYEWMIDWDYSSLYPNLVRTYNIGPNTYLAKIDPELASKLIYERDKLNLDEITTVILDPIHSSHRVEWKIIDLLKFIEENQATINITGTLFKGHEIEKSIFYEIYNYLLETRKIYKKVKFEEGKKGNTVEEKVADNKQWALKILANSLYGVLLNEYFRFFNQDMGRSITLAGQEAIKFAGVHLNQYMENESLDIQLRFEKEVDEELTYLHYVDTDSVFIKIGDYIINRKKKDVTVERIFEAVAELDPILNNSIIKPFATMHNILPQHSFLQLKQEIICDKAYFLNTKKKYGLHIINQEGYEKDKYDIKGIETRRSDYSIHTKKMLMEILTKIFKSGPEGVDVDDIVEYVDGVREEVKNLAADGNKLIGKPVSFAQSLKTYKMVPQGIRGMLLWNALMYDVFKTGMKGMLFQIKGIDLEKAPDYVRDNYTNKFLKKWKASDLNVIVIPDEEEKLPEWFIPNVNAITKFAVDDRADLLLQPLFSKSNEILTF